MYDRSFGDPVTFVANAGVPMTDFTTGAVQAAAAPATAARRMNCRRSNSLRLRSFPICSEQPFAAVVGRDCLPPKAIVRRTISEAVQASYPPPPVKELRRLTQVDASSIHGSRITRRA